MRRAAFMRPCNFCINRKKDGNTVDGKTLDGKTRRNIMKLGEFQELTIIKMTDFGAYLAQETNTADKVLLPAKQLPKDAKLGMRLKVFLYKDSQDRLIATVNEPLLTIGKFGVLKVKEITKIGAFLDWGLEKDLFLPYKQMVGRIDAGDEVLVSMYIDKSERLCATMRGLYHLLSQRAPYEAGDMVRGRVYEFSDNFGTFVAVDDKYSARIPKHEGHQDLKIGDIIEAKVVAVKEDGKLDLTMREKAYIQMDTDADKILSLLNEYAGVLPFTEKASPEVIARETGLSKAAFKRAIGHLYKERKITLDDGKIRLNR